MVPPGYAEPTLALCPSHSGSAKELGEGLAALHRVAEARTEARTRRAFPASPAHLTRSTMRFALNRATVNGRSWDRTSDLPRVKRALSR